MAPAITLAYDGVPVASSLARALVADAPRLAADPGLRAIFFPDGCPLAEGETLLQPALARSLEAIAGRGRLSGVS